MNRNSLFAVAALSLMACGAPEDAPYETDNESAIEGDWSGAVAYYTKCLWKTSISTKDPLMSIPDGCSFPTGLVAGKACLYGEQCETGLCVADPNGKGVCGQMAYTTSFCAETYGPGWTAAHAPIGGSDVYSICTPKGRVRTPPCGGTCGYNASCGKNEDCGSEICVKPYGSSTGRCGEFLNSVCGGKTGVVINSMPDTSWLCYPAL